MRRFAKTLIPVLMLCGVATLVAQPETPAAETPNKRTPAVDINTPAMQAKVAELAGLPRAERTAALKAMNPAERRGFWMAVQKAVRADTLDKMPGEPQRIPLSGVGQKALKPKVVGTIQYDSGAPTASFVVGGALLGNRFDTRTGSFPILASGTVSTVSAVVVPHATATTTMGRSAGFVLHGPQTTMGGANALFSVFTGAATGGSFLANFGAMGVTYTGSEFFVLFGAFSGSYLPAFGPGTANGQGIHGVVGYTGGMGPNVTNIIPGGALGGTLNGFIRATGNITPVELMTFTAE